MDANTVAAVMSRRFRLDSAPTLGAPTMSQTPIAFTRLRCMDEQHGRAGPVPCENSFAFQVMLQPIRSWDLTTNRGLSPLPPTKPGDAFLFDLGENPRVNIESSFDMVRFIFLKIHSTVWRTSAICDRSEGCGHRRQAPTIRSRTAWRSP